jgi:EmrB/QacA subfamily drug resistance transporter
LFTVVTLALFLQSLDATIVATALHSMQVDLGTSINWTGWTITIYALVMVLVLPVAARLSDRLGRKRVFLSAVAGFGVASLLCGLADSIQMLIAVRALQAACGAAFTPSATGIVVDHFGQDRDRAVGLFGTAFQIGAITGPVLGGLVVTSLSWRWVFFVNVPLCVALVVAGLVVIPNGPLRGGRSSELDLAGATLLGAAILAAMVSAGFLGARSPAAWAAAACTGVTAALLLWGFLRRIHRVRNPFINPVLIHGHGFAAVNLVNFLYGGATVGVLSLLPLYATSRFHIDALRSGTLLTAEALAGIVTAVVGALALRRTGYRLPIFIGALLASIGMLGLAIGPRGGLSAFAWLAGAAALVGVGSGWADPASRNAGLQLLPEESASLAALRTMARRAGTVAAVSLMTAAIAQSTSPGNVHAIAIAGFGVLLLAGAPIAARIPEHRGAW